MRARRSLQKLAVAASFAVLPAAATAIGSGCGDDRPSSVAADDRDGSDASDSQRPTADAPVARDAACALDPSISDPSTIRRTGTLAWARPFVAPSDAGRGTVASVEIRADADGNVLVAGAFAGSIDFGTGALVSAGGYDAFLVKLGPSKEVLWAKSLGGPDDEQAGGLTVDASGNVYVSGSFGGSVDFGGGPLVSAGDKDAFLAKYDAAGKHVWSKRFGDASFQSGLELALSGCSSIVLYASLLGTTNFGGETVTAGDGGVELQTLAKFDLSGNHVWTKPIPSGGRASITGLSVDGSENIVVAGWFGKSIDFGGEVLNALGTTDVFVAKLASNGARVWSKRYGDLTAQTGDGVAVDPSGNVFVSGTFGGTIDFGAGAVASKGNGDIFLTKLDPSGNGVWTKSFGDGEIQNGGPVAVDRRGDVLVTGGFYGQVDFGGGPMTGSTGASPIFYLAKLDGSGAFLWQKGGASMSSPYSDFTSVAVDSKEHVFAGGWFRGTIDVGGGALVAEPGATNGLVAAFAP